MKFATFTADGAQHYGAVTEGGVIALSGDFPQWATMRDVVENDGFSALAKAAEGRSVTHKDGSFRWDIPVPNPEKIICVGVNFPAASRAFSVLMGAGMG